jgi:predicted MFS family arabinose efflux permease
MSKEDSLQTSTWSPLRHAFFRTLWIANVVSLIGTWMHEVGAAWLMTGLAPSPFMVAMVLTANTLPFFLLALPSGALADILDRRRLLIFAQIWMLCVSAGLGVTTVVGSTTPLILLAFTFLLSLGAAINAPAWQAIIPELVQRRDLPAAVTLGSIGFNLARVTGPALGGIVVAAFGPGATFLLNGVSFLGVIIVLKRWRSVRKENILPEERFISAMKTGIRYVRNAPQVRMVLFHCIIFSFFSTTLWAFLPIIARSRLGLSSFGYGVLMGLFGAGGLTGAPLLHRWRQKVSLNLLVTITTNLFALSLLSLAFVRSTILVGIAMIAAGVAWLIALSIFNMVMQGVIPAWVRGRVMSVYLLVFFAGMAAGSALCGTMATWIGIPATIAIMATCLIIGSFLGRRFRLASGEELDLTPSQSWPSSVRSYEPEIDEGPVLVTVEYVVDPLQSEGFTRAMKRLKMIRRRDGAIKWNLFHDVTDSRHYVESFIIESWGEHLRQHERMTVSDKEILDRATSFHVGPERQIVKHFIAE